MNTRNWSVKTNIFKDIFKIQQFTPLIQYYTKLYYLFKLCFVNNEHFLSALFVTSRFETTTGGERLNVPRRLQKQWNKWNSSFLFMPDN